MMLKEMADEALIALYQKGNKQAFTVLFNRHSRGIYNFILRFFGQAQLAEDLFQDAFMRLVTHASRYEPKTKFTTWMYTIVRNLCIDEYRKKKIRKVVSIEDHMKSRNDTSMPDTKAVPVDEQVITEEKKHYVSMAIERLSVEQREVVLLREKRGLSFAEVAEITGESVNTVKSRMRYALVNLKKELKEMKVFDELKPHREKSRDHELS